ncbi:MAG: hypothetical protein Q8N79_09960 [Candidatus Methanoperedens sp.]|nr:hypothetical protein [Candidatus Methanoperedens sp.]
MAPDMPLNSLKAHRSDPAIIEDTAFNHLRKELAGFQAEEGESNKYTPPV